MSSHLIHIGYPKTGSTFLQQWFEGHPALHYAPGGLAGFRDVYEMCRDSPERGRLHVTSYENLAIPWQNHDPSRVHGPGETAPERIPLKARQAEVCVLLAALYPASRILIVTRGFRGMVLSSYSQAVRAGGMDDLATMCDALRESFERDDDHYFDYDHLVGLYAAAFGEENVIVLPYELLRDDRRRFIRELEERLGVEHAEVEVGRVNASLSPGELYWYPRIAAAASRAVGRIAPGREARFNRWYRSREIYGRLRPLVRVAEWVRPGRGVTEAALPAELFRLCAGRASRLAANPLYAPYADDYLFARP